jgi:hypothetical protein
LAALNPTPTAALLTAPMRQPSPVKLAAQSKRGKKMNTYKFTYVAKQYFDVDIQAATLDDARDQFENLLADDKIDWQNPDYLDSDSYYEEITA